MFPFDYFKHLFQLPRLDDDIFENQNLTSLVFGPFIFQLFLAFIIHHMLFVHHVLVF